MSQSCLVVDFASDLVGTALAIEQVEIFLDFLPMCPANLQGPAGARGSDILFGTTTPDNQNGVTGDIYVWVGP